MPKQTKKIEGRKYRLIDTWKGGPYVSYGRMRREITHPNNKRTKFHTEKHGDKYLVYYAERKSPTKKKHKKRHTRDMFGFGRLF